MNNKTVYVRASRVVNLKDINNVKSNLRYLLKQNIPSNLSKYKKRQLTLAKKYFKLGQREESLCLYKRFIGITKKNKIRKKSIAEYKFRRNDFNVSIETRKRISNSWQVKEVKFNNTHFIESMQSLSCEELASILREYNLPQYLMEFIKDTDKGWSIRVRSALGVPDTMTSNQFNEWLLNRMKECNLM